MGKKMVVFVGVLSLMLASGAIAGPLAGTIPEGTATVDGNLADWAGTAWRTGTLQTGYYTGSSVTSANEDVVTANTRFAARWEANPDPSTPGRIYAAMEVVDTNHIFLDSFTEWCATDRVEWFVHGLGPVDRYCSDMQEAQQYVMSPKLSDPSTPWIGMGYKKGTPESMGLAPEYAVSVNGDTITYEVSLEVFDVFGGMSGATTVPTQLEAGITIGFDVLVGSRIAGWPGSYEANNYYLLDETGVSSGTVHKADGPSDGMQEFTLVPEPATMGLVLMGLFGLIRRK